MIVPMISASSVLVALARCIIRLKQIITMLEISDTHLYLIHDNLS